MIKYNFEEMMELIGVPKTINETPVNDPKLTKEGNAWFTLLSQYSFNEEHECLPGWYFISYKDCIPLNEISEHFEDEPLRNNFLLLTDYSDGGCGVGFKGEKYQSEIVVREIHEPWSLGFLDISALINTSIACWKEKVWNENGEPDFDKFYDISSKINPNYNIWSE